MKYQMIYADPPLKYLWGFKYKTCTFTLVKVCKDGIPLMVPGSYSRANAEIVLLGMRGYINSVSHSVPQIMMYERLGILPNRLLSAIELFNCSVTEAVSNSLPVKKLTVGMQSAIASTE
ncbi:MAG: hypothetical protein LBS54_05450 [Dysgonamonadaceae bacterium]|jgi:N6-adenosine-specific RNA methylase IME4|nr:hypothetical protein [Dysgonamonadaceae bacterium]